MIQVTCAILVQDGLVLAAQRSASMRLPLKWEFPGGKLEADESMEECMRRELREELGIEVDLLSQGPGVFYPRSNPEIELIPFVARIISGVLNPAEHAELRWCSAEELSQLDWAEADIDVLRWWLSTDLPPSGYKT